MEVEGAGRLQDAAHLDEADGHHDQVGLIAIAIHGADGLDEAGQAGVGGGDFVDPGFVDIGEGPSILEGGAGGRAADGGRPLLFGIEGRVEVDEVDGFIGDAAQGEDVIGGEDGAVDDVVGSGMIREYGRVFYTEFERMGGVCLSMKMCMGEPHHTAAKICLANWCVRQEPRSFRCRSQGIVSKATWTLATATGQRLIR